MYLKCWLNGKIFNYLTHITEYTLPHYLLEESIFEFWYIRLYDVDIHQEKMDELF